MTLPLLRGLAALGAVGLACSVVNAPDGPQPNDGGASSTGGGTTTTTSANGGAGGGCSAGLEACGGVCVDTDTSGEHCGACDSPCEPGELCELGACILDCEPALSFCGEACVDTASDPAHCGGCAMPCDPMSEICEESMCLACPQNEVPCDNLCVDTSSDAAHCGGCGLACGPGESCVQATCSLCGDRQVDPGEELDPPPGPSASVPLDPATCRYDFSALTQLYCTGTCGNWGGSANGCDQADADAFCKLKMDNPGSVATSFATMAALAAPGVCCPPPSVQPGSLGCVDLGVLSSRGVLLNISVHDSDVLSTHGSGEVVTNVVCTDP